MRIHLELTVTVVIGLSIGLATLAAGVAVVRRGLEARGNALWMLGTLHGDLERAIAIEYKPGAIWSWRAEPNSEALASAVLVEVAGAVRTPVNAERVWELSKSGGLDWAIIDGQSVGEARFARYVEANPEQYATLLVELGSKRTG